MTEIIAKILGVKPQDLIKEKTSITQRQELQTKIWRIDNDVRGSVDGWDFKHFVLGDTLTNPHVADKKPFDAIVSKPPYAIKWIGDDDPTLIHDDNFTPASVLAPKSKADFALLNL
jgi:type I restriction-modification system DNA methylase subunit